MAKKATKKAPETKVSKDGLDWDTAEQKLIAAEKRKSNDGHFYNTVVAPLREGFNAGGLNPQLYEAMMKL